MPHSCVPSVMVRRWLSIFARAARSIFSSAASSSSRIRRASMRMLFGSSMNSTSSSVVSASATLWASLFTLSRESLTAPPCICALARLYLLEHLLITGAGALHFVLVLLQDEPYLIIDAVFQLQLFQQRVIQRRGNLPHVFGLNELARDKFLGYLPGQVPDEFVGKEHPFLDGMCLKRIV